MNKIAIVGFTNLSNIGDQILCDTCKFVVSKILTHDSEIKIVNFYPYLETIKSRITHLRSMYYYGLCIIAYIFGKNTRFQKINYYLNYYAWKILAYKHFLTELKGENIVIFAGGELKYHNQGVNYGYELLVKVAEKYQLPFMFNSMSISKYNNADYRCLSLSKTINNIFVKCITARDRVANLDEYGIKNNEDKIVSLVGDVAFWIPECYADSILYRKTDFVGINIIRPDVFKDYGYTLSEEKVFEFYINLIHQLNEKKINWVLFSNGMVPDYLFGLNLLKKMEINDKSKLLPRPKTPIELINTIASFKAIFGARMHACITAYSLDIPVVGMIWNDKLLHFSQLIGKRSNYFTIGDDEIDAKKIVATLVNTMNVPYDINRRNELKNLTKQYLKKFIDCYLL